MRSFRGRIAVVTGAAGGIGRAVAKALAERGCHLALTDLREPALHEAAAALTASGAEVTTHAVDVTAPKALERLHEEVLKAHGAAHILVNNAGTTTYGLFEETPREEVKRLLDINLWGVMDGCRIFLPTLRRQDEAHIVNVSSMAAMTGLPFQAAYCASKAAVRGFSEALRAELSTSKVGSPPYCPAPYARPCSRGRRPTTRA